MNPGRHKLQGAGFVPGGLGDEDDLQINVQFFITKCTVGDRLRGHYQYFRPKRIDNGSGCNLPEV